MQKVEDLVVDLGDGLNLHALLEIISSKSIPVNKRPRMKMQKLENLNYALDFLKSEGIKLVGIGATDIEEGNRKLILGMHTRHFKLFVFFVGPANVFQVSFGPLSCVTKYKSPKVTQQRKSFWNGFAPRSLSITSTTLPTTGRPVKPFAPLPRPSSLDKWYVIHTFYDSLLIVSEPAW